MSPAPIAVALDAPDLERAVAWAAAAGPHVSTMKVGLELYLRHGADAVVKVREASGGRDVFLDLKLHDIPNTVAGAARSVADLAPDYLTVHASGGVDMVRAAVEALPGTAVVGVTVLTSMSEADLESVGLRGPSRDAVRRLALVAVQGGARALVCSPQEVADVRREVGPGVTLITPGVRPAGAAHGDQSRVATPEQALADGADLLVIGRPITGAEDVSAAARKLSEAVDGGTSSLRNRPEHAD
ncbi:MAG: orotidine-5'-phosphate decarboxylase [Actinomycetes bacterium]